MVNIIYPHNKFSTTFKNLNIGDFFMAKEYPNTLYLKINIYREPYNSFNFTNNEYGYFTSDWEVIPVNVDIIIKEKQD